MNHQEIFNIVWNGMKSQNFEASGEYIGERIKSFVPLYHSSDGKKCTVGWLIPDEIYVREEIEGFCASDIDYIIENFDTDFIEQLQNLHDDADDPYSPVDPVTMKMRLTDLAVQHNLTIPE